MWVDARDEARALRDNDRSAELIMGLFKRRMLCRAAPSLPRHQCVWPSRQAALRILKQRRHLARHASLDLCDKITHALQLELSPGRCNRACNGRLDDGVAASNCAEALVHSSEQAQQETSSQRGGINT
jgi:hypothetical protein